ncbi:MAG: hypothetical protein JNL72_11900 [Flavipsychrobacter sp.]|nr:hypothetical protein [Flavipsychrobacter sp.]
MNTELLSHLVDQTFAKLSTPAPGTGLYTELKNVISKAFELGKQLGPAEDEINSTISPYSTEPPAETIFHHTAICR